jgi:hypothetical protein
VNFRHLAWYMQLPSAETLLIDEGTEVHAMTFIEFYGRGMTSFIKAEHLNRNEIQASTYLGKQDEGGYRKSLMKPHDLAR